MYWQLTIPENDPEKLSASITVKAENWYSALKDGLEKQGVDSQGISNLTCRIEPDQSVVVTDFITRRVYRLRPLEKSTGSTPPPPPAPADIAAAPGQDGAVPALPRGLAPHALFYVRDEASDGGDGIFYRERLLAVEPGVTRGQVGHLIHAYFQQLKAMGALPETKLFVSVQVFDHVFEDEAKRPAIAALTWREWYPDKPRILFPLSGGESVTFSKLPADPIAPLPAAAETAPPEAPAKRKPSITPPPGDIFAADDKMIQAFERMQEIYRLEDHDSAVEFGLDLSMRLIACEAGRAMLFAPGRDELYVAAARGPGAELLRERKFSLTRGIIGFATQNSVVINVAEPEKDPRFESEIDAQAGFITRSVLCAPIQYEGRTIGALELLNSPHRRGFKQAEVNILAYIGSALAEYLEKSLPSREADFHDKDFSN